MATKKGINETRLKTIYARQNAPSWGNDYVPSILATPAEAPAISHAITLTPAKLNVRETHLLSIPERNSALLGLYHPLVCGLQEQRMLSPEPCPHPLWTFSGVEKTNLPTLKGIIDAAERLEYLDLLPRLNVSNRQQPGETITVVFPWIGDLLWAIREPTGRVYCVNWTIKDTYADFKRSASPRRGKATTGKESRTILARHEIEKTYYEDAQIRTVQIADQSIDWNVSANLRQMFTHHRRSLSLTTEQREEILKKYRTAMDAGISPIEVILVFVDKGRYTEHQCRSLLFQAIWNRELRVDLFHPILINRPLRPETHDVIDVYADWFRG